ncbi:MFS transporter [Acaryochloris marina]|uniref:Nickel resistance protein, putative n=1 Tax=Acaryochloris marina (strain MBIC 11017) TaxID=329726 RepID=B0BZ45_ACAM1|nr:MFS transporter [Acaryochloris marina]ABW28345.1 nickel resistance protein, putative [Acaryochloris marina MBIC11017]
MTKLPRWLQGLENPVFARLYLAQTINLMGDALTWLGLALLAFELAGEQSGTILAGALTLRVTAFVLLSPIAGAIADRMDRKRLMVLNHLMRMGIVCLLPWVTQIWQIYAIVLALNIFYAIFTPTYTATIPLVTTEQQRPQAIALSSATSQLLGVLGPGIAGSIAAWVGTRQVFFLDSITFLLAAILMITLPGRMMVNAQSSTQTPSKIWQDMQTGLTCLWLDPWIRYALALQFIAAIAGAQILVNTVGYVQSTLQLGKTEYGWAMAALGMGATLASIGLGHFRTKYHPISLITLGTLLLVLALLPAHEVLLGGLLLLWGIAGIGQTLVNVTTQTVIADRVAVEVQGRVYGAHFALSHLWWAFAYPVAGWMGSSLASYFFYSSLFGLGLFVMVCAIFRPHQLMQLKRGLWHEHDHDHSDPSHHHHAYSATQHTHLHFHPAP